MPAKPSFSVLLFKEAQEILGEAIKPFQATGRFGDFIPCKSVDTNGPLCVLLIDIQQANATDMSDMSVELQIPYTMIRLIIATEREEHVGFMAK